MNAAATDISAQILGVLSGMAPHANPQARLQELISRGLDQLPLPGSGRTLERWRTLSTVAEFDLSLAKLYEGHTDAVAILTELGAAEHLGDRAIWGTWAAEAPDGRAIIESVDGDQVELSGGKNWCSGAGFVTCGLLTAWFADGRGPQLVKVPMKQAGVGVRRAAWHAVGMADTCSFDISFDHAHGQLIGIARDYLTRPGFWQGGAGIAACWYGGALSLARALRRASRTDGDRQPDGFRLAALGKVDVALQLTMQALQKAAAAIDANPQRDFQLEAMRVRLAAEDCALRVAREAGRSLGAGAFCRDAHFARLAADLPVFVRQSHGERDYAALGGLVGSSEESAWTL